MTSPYRRPSPVARRLLAVAALLSAAFTVGCWRPLAHQHEYFAPWSGTAARIGAETRHTVSHYRALQAASHACAPRSPAAAGLPSPPPSGAKAIGPGASPRTSPPGGPARLPTPAPGGAAAPEALADLCAPPARPDVAAYGGASNAYGRWVRDEVRKLPAASRTAASAAGGS